MGLPTNVNDDTVINVCGELVKKYDDGYFNPVVGSYKTS